MRFGTVPIVSRDGGLVETVVGYDDPQGDSPHQATGIVSDGPTVASRYHAITRARPSSAGHQWPLSVWAWGVVRGQPGCLCAV